MPWVCAGQIRVTVGFARVHLPTRGGVDAAVLGSARRVSLRSRTALPKWWAVLTGALVTMVGAPVVAAPRPAAHAAPLARPASSPLSSALPGSVVLFVDADDDDDDGVPDRDQPRGPGKHESPEVRWLQADAGAKTGLRAIRGKAVRVLSGGGTYAEGSPPRDLDVRFGLLGVEPGAARVELTVGTLDARIYEMMPFDGGGARVDMVASHASLSRTLPSSLLPREDRDGTDTDALHWLVKGPLAGMPDELSLISTGADGRPLDTLEHVRLRAMACPGAAAPPLACRTTEPIRAVTDGLDRSHPRALERSLRAEVGGRLIVFSLGQKAASIRVGGPRQTRLGPLERYRARLRVRVLRTGPGGGVAVGWDTAGGIEIARQEVANANALWGQCGVQFGDPADLDVEVVDPPPPHLFAVGCGLGLPAKGGKLLLRVGDRRLEIPTWPGAPPESVAERIATRVRRLGYRALLSPNPRESFAANPSVDVLVRSARGKYVPLDVLPPPSIGGETNLEVCLGAVNLSDGLNHFTDADAAAGTLEERALLKAIADDDPTTIDVLLLPYFVTVGRIGESFVDAAGLGVRNAIIVDRAGVRAGARSFALAHELGHVLLQVAGHPDDFGSDRPTSLMDADAADSSIFGPRRLSVAECERAILQNGPGSPLPLLEPWPLVGR
jgi:hypothetical protein